MSVVTPFIKLIRHMTMDQDNKIDNEPYLAILNMSLVHPTSCWSDMPLSSLIFHT